MGKFPKIKALIELIQGDLLVIFEENRPSFPLAFTINKLHL